MASSSADTLPSTIAPPPVDNDNDDASVTPEDPNVLSELETQRAREIKDAILKEDATLAAEFSDLEYAQLAIVTKGKLQRALSMIRRWSKFKKDHGIIVDESSDAKKASEIAMQVIQDFEKGSKGFLLSCGKDPSTGRHVSVWNYASFTPRSYKSPDDWKTCFAAFYYLCEAAAPDICTIRSGMAIICECDDMGWRNFSLEMEKHGAALFQDCYPLRTKEMTCLNAPLILRAMYALCKPFLKPHIKKIFQMSGTMEEVQERIPKNLLPRALGGTQGQWDMNDKLSKSLQLRYETKAAFKL
ncbi:MAG: hypothetical protein SGARI_005792 [Bacillariaceae sp.]